MVKLVLVLLTTSSAIKLPELNVQDVLSGGLTNDAQLAAALSSLKSASETALKKNKDDESSVPEPITPHLKPFRISMITNPELDAEGLKRIDPATVLAQTNNAEDEEEEVDEEGDPSSVQPQQEMIDSFKKMKESYDSAQKLLKVTQTSIKTAVDEVAKEVAEIKAQKEKEKNQNSGVDIRLYEPGGDVTVVPDEPPRAAGDKPPKFKVLPENVVLPVLYTRPDTMQEVQHMIRYVKDLLLQKFEYKITAINVDYKMRKSLDRIRDEIGMLKALVREMKEDIEARITSTAELAVQGKR